MPKKNLDLYKLKNIDTINNFVTFPLKYTGFVSVHLKTNKKKT